MRVLFICLILTGSMFANTLAKGKALFNDEKFKDAKVVFEKIVDDNDENAEALHWLGRTQVALKETEDGVDNLEEAIELNDKVAEYYYQYARALTIYVNEVSIF